MSEGQHRLLASGQEVVAETPTSERICAVVVTYNRAALLRECLLALQAQTRLVNQILVVNNASTDDSLAMLAREFPQVGVLNLRENMGGAGGFHAGMAWAHEQGAAWTWLMDDDGRPAPDCLAQLLAQRQGDSVLVPVQQDSSGRLYGLWRWQGSGTDITAAALAGQLPLSGAYLFAFVGPLIPHGLVERVGLPIKDFFIRFDDWEYALRIHRYGGKVIFVPDARFLHDFGNQPKRVRFLWWSTFRSEQAPWKQYYGSRNILYVLIRNKRPLREFGIFFAAHFWNLLKDIIYEAQRWQHVHMRLKGMWDGAVGRLGKRV